MSLLHIQITYRLQLQVSPQKRLDCLFLADMQSSSGLAIIVPDSQRRLTDGWRIPNICISLVMNEANL